MALTLVNVAHSLTTRLTRVMLMWLRIVPSPWVLLILVIITSMPNRVTLRFFLSTMIMMMVMVVVMLWFSLIVAGALRLTLD